MKPVPETKPTQSIGDRMNERPPRVVLDLTAEQQAVLRSMLAPGRTVLARAIVRPFATGMPAEQIGELVLEIGAIPTASLPSLRAAILAARSGEPANPCPTVKTKRRGQKRAITGQNHG